MSKISSRPITPMKRRVVGYSKTAPQGITDIVLTLPLKKFKAIRLLKAYGVRKHKLLR